MISLIKYSLFASWMKGFLLIESLVSLLEYLIQTFDLNLWKVNWIKYYKLTFKTFKHELLNIKCYYNYWYFKRTSIDFIELIIVNERNIKLNYVIGIITNPKHTCP